MSNPFKKVFLIILDGFGLAENGAGNAILSAGMPYFESLLRDYPAFSIAASGLVVGLPWGQPGNSEVGHSAIGTGRIVIQDLARINGEIRSGEFYKNPALLEAFNNAKNNNRAIHFMGCTSPGGIHSHVDHLVALLDMARMNDIKKIFVHFIADGQDMPPQDALNVIKFLQPYLDQAGAKIASMQGRSFAMDRILNWKLTEQVWNSVVLGTGKTADDPVKYLESSYAAGQTDYSIEPVTIVENGSPVGLVQDGDSFVFFDFRNDRVKQMAAPFILEKFESFDRVRYPKSVIITTMTKYAEYFNVPVAYHSAELTNTLGQIISEKGWGQWRIAEKEKEAHVTNFFNGGRIEPLKEEQRDIVSSRMMKGKEYLEHPEMSAEKIVDSVLAKASDNSKLFVINFANPDMIGHAGDLAATQKAIKIIDDCLKRLVGELLKDKDIAIVITADHGNAEELIDPLTGGEDTQHSTRNVPAIAIATALKNAVAAEVSLEILSQMAPSGSLVDVAPTVLHLLGLDKPAEMTGSKLITLS